MSRPLIGISARNGHDLDGHATVVLQHSYITAVAAAGAIAIPIPSNLPEDVLYDLYQKLYGILFSGGGDIALDYFDGVAHPRIDGVDLLRDSTELALLKAAAQDGKAMLGICRGAQLINVGLGGTLYTHIPDQVPGALDHDYPGHLRRYLVHPVNLDEVSRSAEIFGETLLHVNSLH